MINSCFLQALNREPVASPPVWVMRQAGRYDPDFRKLRAQCPQFMEFCQQPELAYQATMLPLKKFQFDAAILFSDILTLPHACGQKVHFEPGIGPIITPRIQNKDDFKILGMPDMEDDLGYVGKAIELLKKDLKVPLIGFSGSPWTLACYMIEGRGKQGFISPIQMTQSDPILLENVIQLLTKMIIEYLDFQAQKGADCLMIFDSWASLLPPPAYRNFSLNPMATITKELKKRHNKPVLLYPRKPQVTLDAFKECAIDVLGLDETQNLKEQRQLLGPDIILQGNLDPQTLLGSKESVIQATTNMIQKHPQPGYIANLGHGILPNTPIDNLAAFVQSIRSKSTG